jgi:hypothetical protein
MWNFGYDPLVVGNPANIRANAPKSYTTNDKYDYANGIPSPSVPDKFNALDPADLITKEVLEQLIDYIQDVLEIDNGVYYSASNPGCQNYSLGTGNTDTICPL